MLYYVIVVPMPIYEYECAKCHKISEVQQKFADDPLTLCPLDDCDGTVKKIMSMTSFILKGTGYYSTDYKKSPAPAPASAPASAKVDVTPSVSTPTSASGETTTTSAPAAVKSSEKV
jgi:putative FmdB family regulatory protein